MAMKRIVSAVFAAVLMVSLILPLILPSDVNADDLSKNKITLKAGDKVVLSNNIEAIFTGNYDAKDGRPIWKSTVSAPIYAGDFTKKQSIMPSWSFNGRKYVISPNVFTAEYSEGTVWINKGETQWTPTITFIRDGKRVNANITGTPAIINDYINPNYTNNILRISYSSDLGISFTRDLRVIEGELLEYYNFSAYPNADIMISENVKGDKSHMQKASAWDAKRNNIKIDSANDIKIVTRAELNKATYPIVIDPTNTYYTSASDGFVYVGSSAVYSTVHDSDGAAAAVSASGTDSFIGQWDAFTAPDSYQIFRSFFYFDTSALPDTANITAAALSLYGSYDGSFQEFNMVVTNGMPTYPHDPLIGNDYYYLNYSGNGGQTSTATFSVAGYNAINLTATGIGWITTTGTTKFGVLSSRDISSTPPVYGTNELVYVYNYEKGVGYRPKLDITYTATLPTVTTSSATPSCTGATLYGNIDNLGGDVVTFRGFVYGTTSNTTKPAAGQAPPAGYTTNTTENSTAGFPVGAYSGSISGLNKGTAYYYRAYAYNTQGWGYGDQYNFTTWNNPTVATATPTSVTSTTARLQGTMSDGGGTTCQVIWGWGTVDQGNNIEAYEHYLTAWTGSYSTGDNPYYDITGLVASTTYYFNMKSTNSCGNTTATRGTFATGSGISAPTNVVAQPTTNSTIALSWSMISTTPQVNIRYGVNYAPTSNITGIFLYRGSASNYLHQGLTQGSTYYYFVQGYDNVIGYSVDNVTVQATALSVQSGDTAFGLPTLPSNWQTEPSSATFETTNPFARPMVRCFDAVSLPHATGWFLLTMAFALLVGAIAFQMQHDITISLIAMLVLFTFGSIATVIPSYVAWITAPLGIALIFVKARAAG